MYKLVDGSIIRKDLHGYLVYIPGGVIFVNEIGFEILSACKNGTTIEKIINLITTKYSVSPTKAKKDVQEYLKRLMKIGVIQKVPSENDVSL